MNRIEDAFQDVVAANQFLRDGDHELQELFQGDVDYILRFGQLADTLATNFMKMPKKESARIMNAIEAVSDGAFGPEAQEAALVGFQERLEDLYEKDKSLRLLYELVSSAELPSRPGRHFHDDGHSL